MRKISIQILSIFKNTGYVLTYSEWAVLWWWNFAVGVCISYGNYYEYSLPMQLFLASSWFLLVVIGRAHWCNKGKAFVSATANTFTRREAPQSILYVLIVVLIGGVIAVFGYVRTESVIWTYYEMDTNYVRAPGHFIVQLTTDPEVTVRKGEESWKVTGNVKGFMSDAASTNNMVRSEGMVTIYVDKTKPNSEFDSDRTSIFGIASNSNSNSSSDISATANTEPESIGNIRAGSYMLVHGSVLPATHMPEAGRMDMKARYISSGRVGSMHDGEYKGSITAEDMEELFGPRSLQERFLSLSGHLLGPVKQSVKSMLNRELPEELSHLSESLLLGGGYGVLDESIVAAFSKTGLIHILSVSGSHIARLFGFVFFIGRLFKMTERRATNGAIGVVIVYCALVGYNPPVVRSALMGILMGIGILQRKEYAGLQALHISAFLLLIYDPLQLMDISFQLSFGATYGIMLFARSLYQSLPKHMPYIMGPISLCVSAQLIIWPLQIYYFHLLGIGSLLAAVVVAPLLDLAIVALMGLIVVTAILQFMGISGLVSFLWHGLGKLLQLALFMNESIATMPGLVYWSAVLPLILWGLYNMVLYGLYFCMRIKRVRTYMWEVGAYSLLFALLCVANVSLKPDGALRLHTIPLSRGAAFIVMKEQFLSSPESLVYVELDGKELSPYSRMCIINSCHYYGVVKPKYIVLANRAFNREVHKEVYKQVNRRTTGKVNRNSNSEINIPHESDEVEALLKGLQYSNYELNQISNKVFAVGEQRSFEDVAVSVTDGLQVAGIHKSYIFKHRQTGKKTLKLNKDKVTILGTADEGWLQRIEDEPFIEAVLYFPGYKQGTEIDPADEKVYKSGERSIPDFLL
ncbi:MAG: ComEC/Rec2 family competence protein [Veillonella sp.]|uniref:ComEC/Rec2 family competence protein n=1 Tax=Veillonella sp. TaxID=1926307 RepID=UPI0025E8657C|nr:ComEC/Rec2 family competence protein [Veillonella sp.]MBS4912847.1 ComEC/Rec2 family competence protein [Veillonella sp.]